MKKEVIHNLIILDESGSMHGIKAEIISGFNETVESIKGSSQLYPNQEHLISFISFNGMGQKLIHYAEPVQKLDKINAKLYQPNAATPLLDAIGFATHKVKASLPKKNYNVLVTILTDGMENASREYDWNTVKKIIEELKTQNWTFTYIGTGHDLSKVSAQLSIDHTLHFQKDKAGIDQMFAEERAARSAYYKNISESQDSKEDDFF